MRGVPMAEMYMRRITVGLVGLALAIVTPSAHAQNLTSAWTTDVGVAVGAALPQGRRFGTQDVRLDGRGLDMAGGARAGFTVLGLVGIRPSVSPLSLRLEAQYMRLGLKADRRVEIGGEVPVTADGNANILDGTANLVLAMPIGSRIRPYVIGGLGVYRLSSDVSYTTLDGRSLVNSAPSESETKFGLNGGAGIEFTVGALRSFAEARFHSIFTASKQAEFTPITLGLRF